ncbi:hypothetical protein V8C42DRAFT_306655 [Trichoderma barbatum]
MILRTVRRVHSGVAAFMRRGAALGRPKLFKLLFFFFACPALSLMSVHVTTRYPLLRTESYGEKASAASHCGWFSSFSFLGRAFDFASAGLLQSMEKHRVGFWTLFFFLSRGQVNKLYEFIGNANSAAWAAKAI